MKYGHKSSTCKKWAKLFVADSVAKTQKKVIDVVLVSLLSTLNTCNFVKKETPTQVFP